MRHLILRPLVLRLCLLLAGLVSWLEPKPAMADMMLFSSREGIAIGGFDTVAYFESGNAVAGELRYSVTWKGVTWRFASASNQLRFEMNPRAYAPRFGGYCAYAMSKGRLSSGDPQVWVIVDGELFLLHSAAARDLWRAGAGQMIAEARDHWPRLLRQ
ncbi:YHS domain-containing (seleno)protein [Phaeobacter sp. QD34_3]|uniref:YHS domain-containing (seleno)protein n=1 Tax=unclassified Phaeobacter TaxID=2621772 RepID=UPI00237FA706|nr:MULTISPECIES: YHS domain-containing (seleno)protein [unclassified Phaeobacter]MDE4133762.1 YHS domain-containing (seleno)protein [Phaeobacter sp. QD34_3]MDE4137305.1 YHS domain-containing (seleno)protein [Phaeobacter sp. QD34_24]